MSCSRMDVTLRLQTYLVLQLSSYFLWIGSDATCRNEQSQIPLTNVKDTISYLDDYKFADCSYVFPDVQPEEYDIMLAYVTKIDMQYPSGSGCAADVMIGDMKFCKMPEGCFLYYTTRSKCGLDEIQNIFINGSLPCNNTSLILAESFPSKFQIVSKDSKLKSVTLKYQYIKCKDKSAAGLRNIQALCLTRSGTRESKSETYTDPKAGQSDLSEKPTFAKKTSGSTAPLGVDEDVVTNYVPTPTIVDHKRYTECPESYQLAHASSCNVSIATAITLGVILIFSAASFIAYQKFIIRKRAKFSVNGEDKKAMETTAPTTEEISRLSA